jgi:hypothetical protein
MTATAATFASPTRESLAIAGTLRSIASVAFYVGQERTAGRADPVWNAPTVANRGRDLDGFILQSWGRPDRKLYNLPGFYA